MPSLNDLKTVFIHALAHLDNEIKQRQHADEPSKITGDITNSAGNLTLHLAGSLNHFIGAQLGKTGYVRDRDNEFVLRDVHRDVLIRMIAETRSVLEQSFDSLKEEDLGKIFPLSTFGENRTNGYALLVLSGHLNYHLGQINYLRRFFSPHAL